MKHHNSVIVIGAGIAGLTASAILSHEKLSVTLLEAHQQAGGCAGTFNRGKYIFDVGATQVAGFEAGGIHERLFRYLQYPAPKATLLDPACVVDLCDGSQPITLWHDSKRWEKERKHQFPGSDSFWNLCYSLHRSNWSIASRDPVLPIRNKWDLVQLLKAIKLNNMPSNLYSLLSVGDLLKLSGCQQDERLKKFLDLQLMLYSQNSADKTAALYGATVLQIAQEPLGLWHIEGSMQKLSNHLASAIERDKGKLLLRHKVVRLSFNQNQKLWQVEVVKKDGAKQIFQSPDVICTLPPQCLLDLMDEDCGMPNNYRKRLINLAIPTGAIVFYGAIKRNALRGESPSHMQISSKELGSIFISISVDGDGRAPLGEAIFIASLFADLEEWSLFNQHDYQLQKQLILSLILKELDSYFGLVAEDWIHQELSTPRSFLKWTGRPKGMVGGLGAQPFNFGIFGLPSRTPIQGLWLCGDSIYPGEGTAGVTQSALMVCKQLIASRGGSEFHLPL